MTMWTTDRPTVPGWYWYKRDNTMPPRLVAATALADGSGVDIIDNDIRILMSLARDSAFWPNGPNGPKIAGPITPPPPAPEFPSTAEAMALAVLAGDMVAARALADWITDHT